MGRGGGASLRSPERRSGGSSTQLSPMWLGPCPRAPGPHRPAPRARGCRAARGGGVRLFQTRARAAPWVCFPGTFLLLSSGEDSSGEGRRGEGPAHARCIKAQTSRPPLPRHCPFRATMRGVSCHLLLGETSGLRGPGGSSRDMAQPGRDRQSPRTCAPQKVPRGCQVLMGLSVANLGAKREKLRQEDT